MTPEFILQSLPRYLSWSLDLHKYFTLSNSLSCEIYTKFSLSWDITSSLCLLILASYAAMARVVKQFPSSWWESQALLFIHKYPQERFPKGRVGLMLASPWDREGGYNMWGVCACGACVCSHTLLGSCACYCTVMCNMIMTQCVSIALPFLA